MIITVDPAAEAPPFAQVRSQLLEAIATGALHPGTRLPTIRQLAGDLGLANNTVARAYRELLADGVLESRGRRARSCATGPPTSYPTPAANGWMSWCATTSTAPARSGCPQTRSSAPSPGHWAPELSTPTPQDHPKWGVESAL